MNLSRIAAAALLLTASVSAVAQESRTAERGAAQCAAFKKAASKNAAKTTILSNAELDYDMKYVKLDLAMNNMNTTISGNAVTKAVVTAASLSGYAFELDNTMTIDSVLINGANTPFTAGTSLQVANLSTALPQGSLFTAQVFYHGTSPATSGSFPKGLNNMSSPSWGNRVTYTLSESYAANDWWPSKQLLTDKIDSSDVWITVPDSVKAGSNGVLQNVTTLSGSRRRYEWHNNRTIDYYLISASVAGYIDYSFYQHFTGSTDSVLIQNYVYNNPNTLPYWQDEIDSTGLMMDYFSTLYGRYPFWQQKYGHCMAPLSGGMEHQTMTTQGNFSTTLTVHEFGHQWFGDNVTCASWKDIWLNEGFASYTEYLYAYHFWSPAQGFDYMDNVHSSVMGEPDGSVYVPDTTDENRIFDSRLSYDKASAAIHTLRFWVGNDSLFYAALGNYQQAYGNGTALTTDFQSSMEASAGMDLDTFFNEWIFGEGYPTYSASWNQAGNTVFVKLDQTTSDPGSIAAFYGPMELKLKSAAGDTVVRVNNYANGEVFSFTWSKAMNGLSIDPNDWITNQTGTISHDAALDVKEAMAGGNLSVRPNPSGTTWQLGNLPANAQLALTDAAGQTLWRAVATGPAIDVPAAQLAPGVYFLQCSGAAGRAVVKLVRQ